MKKSTTIFHYHAGRSLTICKETKPGLFLQFDFLNSGKIKGFFSDSLEEALELFILCPPFFQLYVLKILL